MPKGNIGRAVRLIRSFLSGNYLRFVSCFPVIQQSAKMVKANERKVINFSPGPAKLPQEVQINRVLSQDSRSVLFVFVNLDFPFFPML